MSEGYFGKREKLYLSDLHRGLIVANHILHHHRVFDTCGHISVRNPDNPTASFWLPQDLPPALLSSAIQLIEYNIDDGEQTEKDERRKPPIERFMHSEIYKKFPDVNCVVSGHCLEVISYTWGGVPLRSMNNKCAFLGSTVPVWNYPSSASPRDFLVRNTELGHQLAAAFKPATSAGFIMGKVRGALPTSLTGSSSDPPTDPEKLPDHPVVLMQGHGFSVASASLEEAVYMAINTREAAVLQSMSMQNAVAWNILESKASVEGKVNIDGGGKILNGKLRLEGKDGGLKFLNTKEAGESWATMGKTVSKSWALWCREVEVNPLYRYED